MLLHSESGTITYWVNKIPMLPLLSKIALRILATPAFSSSSERDFSGLKTMLPSWRTLLKDDIIDEVLLLRSFLRKQ